VQLNLPAIAEVEQIITIGAGQTHLRRVGDLLQGARESKKELDQRKVVLGGLNYSAQYQQCPLPLEGEIIKWKWFRFYDVLPSREPGDQIVQSWDTAYKADEHSDYSVCTTWLVRGNSYYLIDVLREKLLYPELKKKAFEHALVHQADALLVENKGSGITLIDDLCAWTGPGMRRPIACDPEGDKVTRMATKSAMIEAGHVLLPRTAAWLGDFQNELLQFPYGRHDDQVDSVSQFLNWISQRTVFSYDMGYEPLRSDSKPHPLLVQSAPQQPNVLIADWRRGGRLVPASDYAKQIEEAQSVQALRGSGGEDREN
jgi:predicted phage terminase large subunit-like protein